VSQLQHFYKASESYLDLRLQQARILSNHPNVKGDTIENFVKELLEEYMPTRCKVHSSGHIVWGNDADNPGTLYDLIIYSPDICGPLSTIGSHSIFPLECIVGAIEATASINKRKMKKDVDKLTRLRLMNRKFYWLSTGSTTHEAVYEKIEITPRCFIFAAESHWKTIETCAKDLQELLIETHEKEAHIHGLYIRNLGFFDVEPRQNELLFFTIRCKKENPLLTFIEQVRISIYRFPKVSDISRVYYENGNNKDECINLTHPFILYPRLEKYQMGDSGFQIICQGVTEEYLDNNKRGAP
jgi:Domain of unknown function (DUF6602)